MVSLLLLFLTERRSLRDQQVHREPSVGGRQEVRHALVRARHLLQTFESVQVRGRLRSLLQRPLLVRRWRVGQPFHALDERGHPEAAGKKLSSLLSS